jgi:hypothetical protein
VFIKESGVEKPFPFIVSPCKTIILMASRVLREENPHGHSQLWGLEFVQKNAAAFTAATKAKEA